jgi:hypothetical protein
MWKQHPPVSIPKIALQSDVSDAPRVLPFIWHPSLGFIALAQLSALIRSYKVYDSPTDHGMF